MNMDDLMEALYALYEQMGCDGEALTNVKFIELDSDGQRLIVHVQEEE